jgi:hypothetical protein
MNDALRNAAAGELFAVMEAEYTRIPIQPGDITARMIQDRFSLKSANAAHIRMQKFAKDHPEWEYIKVYDEANNTRPRVLRKKG